jgi:hypothetical protein
MFMSDWHGSWRASVILTAGSTRVDTSGEVKKWAMPKLKFFSSFLVES